MRLYLDSGRSEVNVSRRSQEELERDGFAALVEALGMADAMRFLRVLDPGNGDYTAERHTILGDPTLDEVLQELKRLRAEKSNSLRAAPSDWKAAKGP